MTVADLFKGFLFVALLGGFVVAVLFGVGGADSGELRRGELRAIMLFGVGAATAIWGKKETTGALDPISLRGLFIILGVALMVFGCVLAFSS